MASALQRVVADYCRRHELLVSSEPMLVMVSGGADSVCMMHAMRELHDGPVHVLTLDHGLRPEAQHEAESVRVHSEALGLTCQVEHLSLDDGPDLQERARDARRRVADEVADRLGCSRVATGHTATDQAETVLFRIARGTGRTGALGIAPRRGRFIRPMLGVTRQDARTWCEERDLAVVDDPANEDPRFTRSRVRHGLLAALADIHDGAERNLAAFADRLRDEDTLITERIDAAWSRCTGADGLSVSRLREQPRPLQRLLLRRLIADAGLGGSARESRHVDRVRDLIDHPAKIELPGGHALIVDEHVVIRPHEDGAG